MEFVFQNRSMPEYQAYDAGNGDAAARQRPNGDFFTFKNPGQRKHDNRGCGNDGGNYAGWRIFERPLHATDTYGLAGKAVDQDPRPELPLFAW